MLNKVSDRTVKAAYAVFASKIRFEPRLIVHPFPSPHTLAWYLGTQSTPDEVRVFATGLKSFNTRVWSVAHGASSLVPHLDEAEAVKESDDRIITLGASVRKPVQAAAAQRRKFEDAGAEDILPASITLPAYAEDWVLLVQVHGASSDDEACSAVEIQTRGNLKKLKTFALKEIRSVDTALFPDAFMPMLERQAGAMLKRQGVGHWVEIALDRRLA